MDRITIFSGNRAEFGILFPIIQQLSEDFEVEIILSGAHVLKKWNTREEVKNQLKKHQVKCKVTEIEIEDNEKTYTHCLSEIYEKVIEYYEQMRDISLGIVLGDRIESFAFALATFYSQVPLIHVCGGDVVNVANYDTNVRHSISKLANYHFVTSEQSRRVLLQMGEEKERVCNIGNPSFDYDRMGLLTEPQQLKMMYDISGDDIITIFTFHPASMKSAEDNFKEFKFSLDAVVDSKTDKVIVTYPNNDPGYELILAYIQQLKEDEKIIPVNSLGTYNYLSLMKNFNVIIAGNSSSGLLETTLYCVPVVNIGERQAERIRGCNVKDVGVDYSAIKKSIDDIVTNYSKEKESYSVSKFVFGDGNAAIKAKDFIVEILKKDRKERLFKKFIIK